MDAVLMKRGGSGSSLIHVWKQYEVNVTTTYLWDKYSLKKVWVGTKSPTTIRIYDNYYSYIGQTAELDKSDGNYKYTNGATDCGNYVHIGTKLSEGKYEGVFGQYEKTRKLSEVVGWYVSGRDSGNLPGRYAYQIREGYCTGMGSDGDYGYSWLEGIPAWQYQAAQADDKDTLIESITSTDSSAYPSNGISGSYWYVSAGSDTSYSQGPFKQNVYSTNPNLYPQNGISNGFWYVYSGAIS